MFCKYCGKEMDDSATFCPECGKPVNENIEVSRKNRKQSKKEKKHPILAVILIVLAIFLIVAAVSGGEGNDNEKTSGSSSIANVSPAPTEKTEFTVGDKVDLNDISVTLVNVTENAGSAYNKPSDGNVFVLFEFNIENNSKKDIAVSSIMSFEAYADDYTANMSLSAQLTTDKNQLDGTIAAGKKMNGVIGYEVSKDFTEVEIRFTPDFWAGKDITFTYRK